MQKPITNVSGTTDIENAQSGGVGGFLEAFKAAMADGKISEAETKDLMKMMQDLIAEVKGDKSNSSDKASSLGDSKPGADLNLEQEMLKTIMGALDDTTKAEGSSKAA
jgi:hypothetical protein